MKTRTTLLALCLASFASLGVSLGAGGQAVPPPPPPPPPAGPVPAPMQGRGVVGGVASGGGSGRASVPPAPLVATSLIVGRVIDPGSNKGVSGAVVTLNGGPARVAVQAQPGMPVSAPPPPAPPPQILTDSDGRFAFMNLTRGNYTLTATKSGYSSGAYGRIRPGGPTRPLQLDDGEKLADATIRLFKLGSISGTVTDDAGEPVVSTTIRVYRRSLLSGRRVLTPSGGQVSTDDRGMYRIANLQPGEYVVVAPVVPVTVPANSQGPGNRPNLQATASGLSFGSPIPGAGGQAIGPDSRFLLQRSNGISGDVAAAQDPSGRIVGFSTVYYPNAPTASGAQIVSIASGEERSGIDIPLRRVPTVSISGIINGSPDGMAADYAVRLVAADGDDILQEPESAVAMSDASGLFMFLGVPSGQYLVQVVKVPRRGAPVEMVMPRVDGPVALAQYQATQTSAEPLMWATVPVSVSDTDIHGLALTLREGLTISGRLEFNGSRPRPDPQRLAQAQIMIEPADGRMQEYDQGPPSRVQQDGRFITTGRLPGKYFIRSGGVAGGWNLERITANGVDVTDSPVDLSTSNLTNVVITFTDQIQDLRGTVSNVPQGAEAPGVVVFPADSNAWKNFGVNPARMRMTRAAGTGNQFSVGSLPPGDYYIAAIPDEYSGEWQDPAYLELLARAGTRFSLASGERKTLDVSVQDIRPPSIGRQPVPQPVPEIHAGDADERQHGPFVEESASDDPEPQQVRDTRTSQPTGAGSISGVVRLDDGSNAPARFARVSIRSSTTPGERVALTDAEGRYTVVGLPAGTYQVQVTKPAYLSMYYGARRPVIAQGSPVKVEPGQKVTGIDVKLQRGGVVTGVVIGTDGEPAPGARISLYQRTMSDGELRLTGAPTMGQTVTDDHGMFRLFGIRPGSYAIAATPPNTVLGSAEIRQLSDQELRTAMAAAATAKAPPMTGRTLAPASGPPPAVPPAGRPVGFSPVFYPGTLVEEEAGIFALAPGQEMRVSISLQLVPTARIEGTVVTADGQPAPVNGVQVMLQRVTGSSSMSTSMRMTEPGRFQAIGVPPGRYQLIARWNQQETRAPGATPQGQASTTQWYAQEQIDVTGVDLSGITLAFAPPITLSGKVVFDGTPPGGDAQVQIRLDSAGRAPAGSFARTIKPAEGGQFSIPNVTPGRYRLNAFVTVPNPGAVAPGSAPPPWQVRSAVVDGRDALETPFEVAPGRVPSSAVVTLTTRLPQLTATITDKTGAAVPNMIFVLFSVSREHWTGTSSRRVRSITRPNDEGAYLFTSLLPGDYFLVVLNDLEPSDLNDPAFLEQLIPAAVRVTLAEGDKKVQNLRIAGGG